MAREKLSFDEGWRFHRGDIEQELPSTKSITYLGAKTERKLMGPACKDYFSVPDPYVPNVEFKSERWDHVTLPHDYIIGDEPDVKYNNGLGFFKYDNAWYIKKFNLPEEDEGKRLTLYFEGVATHATVYLNGCLLKHNFCGYTSFEVDITDVAAYGGENTLSVYVSTKEHEGWWYEGGGIYRHVWLIKTEKVSVNLWGVYVKPQKQDGKNWLVSVETEVRNDDDNNHRVRVEHFIAKRGGKLKALADVSASCPLREIKTLKCASVVSSPALWSPDSPAMYDLTTRVYVGDKQVDEVVTPFGFRYFECDKDKGLFINGKSYKINGLCGHADCGLTGKAVSDNIHRYKVKLMKDMGANGYRTSHYMQAEALMDALDENGFIVMDETRWFESSDEGKEQLAALIKRDRNRPGVFFWSIGNEEKYFAKPQGRRIAKSLRALVKKMDDRPVTCAVDLPNGATVFEESDVIGINYNLRHVDGVREKYKNKAFYLSECSAVGRTRDWYFDSDVTRGYNNSYENGTLGYFEGREDTWKFVYDRPWVMGGYQWIAFEHRGEAVWPRVCSQSGCVDLFLQKKDSFYQNKSFWTDENFLYIAPHWTFPGFEGETIRVAAYTNCDEVELFLNGKSVGRNRTSRFAHGEWRVVYEPGTLEAVGYKDGKEVVRDVRKTAGKPYALTLTLDTEDVAANGKDVAVFTCVCVDENGVEVPYADPVVDFVAEGAGSVLSTGSDVAEHASVFSPRRKMRAGRIGLAVKLGKTPGQLRVYALSPDLKPAIFKTDLKGE